MLPEGPTSAEPAKAGREGASDPEPARPATRHGEGNRTDGRSLVTQYPTDSEVGGTVARLVERRRSIDGRDVRDLGGDPRSASGKACKARKPESTRGRVGSYSGQGAKVELGNLLALPPPWGADDRSDR